METYAAIQSEDPWTVLGLDSEADEAQIRAAYLAKVKAHPPDRDPEAFERIRDAYQDLSDPRRRGERMLMAVDPAAPLVALLAGKDDRRRFVGPRRWLDAIKET